MRLHHSFCIGPMTDVRTIWFFMEGAGDLAVDRKHNETVTERTTTLATAIANHDNDNTALSGEKSPTLPPPTVRGHYNNAYTGSSPAAPVPRNPIEHNGRFSRRLRFNNVSVLQRRPRGTRVPRKTGPPPRLRHVIKTCRPNTFPGDGRRDIKSRRDDDGARFCESKTAAPRVVPSFPSGPTNVPVRWKPGGCWNCCLDVDNVTDFR